MSLQPNRSFKKLNVAIFGLGRIGSIHFGNIVRDPRAVIRYIVEADKERAEQVINHWQFDLGDKCKLVSAVKADMVYEDNSVDAVIVCSHTETHKDIVKKALQAGKSVFCEKPIAIALSDTKACYDIAEKNGKFLFCAFNRRQDPSIRQLQQRVRNGDLGQVKCIKTCSRDNPFPPLEYFKISGGIFQDCAIHDIDMVCWILGEFPEVVYTQGHAFYKEIGELGDADQVNITMKFPSGVIATIDLNRDATYGFDQRLEVFGSKGMLETRNKGKINIVSHIGNSGCTAEPISYSFPQRYADAYVAEMDYFISHELGLDDHIEVTATETVMAVLIADTCQLSYRTESPIKMKDMM